jgi:mannose-6-phosphate isomerase
MHLLEAALAWMELDDDGRWITLAGEIVELASTRFVDNGQGFVREYFDANWQALSGVTGRIVEPGHQFEWAWLLLRWYERTGEERIRDIALHLIDLAECHGVDRDRGVAVNSLLDDGSLRDPVARLWPQTERMKAACLAATVTRDEQYWRSAVAATRNLSRYLDTPLPGMWRDRMLIDGSFVVESVPASSFYHIVGAIGALDRALTHPGRR